MTSQRNRPSTDLSAVSASVLTCFPNPHPDLQEEILHEAFEFTHLCPFTGHPDFARLEIRFVPGARCVELKSLKDYLLQFRNVGVSYEQLIGHVAKTLFRRMAPRRLTVTGYWSGRGGIRSIVSVSLPDPRARRR